MNNFLRDLCQFMETDGIGTFATDLFAAKEPDSPDNCVTVYRTGGEADDSLDINSTMERPTFQVRVRNKNYEAGWLVMDQVVALFGKAKFLQINDSNGLTNYTFWRTELPIDLRRDTQNRFICVANYRCMRQPGTAP